MISAQNALKLTNSKDARVYKKALAHVDELITNRAKCGSTDAIFNVAHLPNDAINKLRAKLRYCKYRVLQAPNVLHIFWSEE